MNLPSHLSRKNNHLWIGEHDCVALAQQYGTPLYVTDAARIRDNYRHYYEALFEYYPDVRVLYAAKANGNPAILRLLAREGAGADVFSAGELLLALQAGIDPSQVLFNGNSKSTGDLALA
ncbi:MAG: diaminopimelate decarboxylase, partial [Methanomicrobiales archaeon]|nr:diaminopimelate decarboxylase [Methanomicrobiales archaeon]